MGDVDVRGLGLVLAGFLLLVVETTLATIVPIHGWAPNLFLPVAIYVGVSPDVPIARGAFLCFGLGYLLDSFTGNLIGLQTLALVAVYLVARAAGLRLFPQGPPFQILFTLVMALASGLLVLALRGLFERPFTFALREHGLTLVRSSIVTALCAPPLFALTRRIVGGAPLTRTEERSA